MMLKCSEFHPDILLDAPARIHPTNLSGVVFPRCLRHIIQKVRFCMVTSGMIGRVYAVSLHILFWINIPDTLSCPLFYKLIFEKKATIWWTWTWTIENLRYTKYWFGLILKHGVVFYWAYLIVSFQEFLLLSLLFILQNQNTNTLSWSIFLFFFNILDLTTGLS